MPYCGHINCYQATPQRSACGIQAIHQYILEISMWHHRMTESSAITEEFRTVVIKFCFNLLPHIYTFIFQMVSFFQVSTPEPCMHSLVPTTCHIPSPPHLYSVGHHNIIWHGVQIMNLLVIQFSPVFCHFLSLNHRYFP